MVASDTVVGIVGAVVLVAVMAGVFVYEYNNPATDSSSSMDDAEHAFLDAYPTLNASGDLDQDGSLNMNDNDIDGDGTPNANDTMVDVTTKLSGSRPQVLPNGNDAGQKFTIYVGTGAEHLTGTITYTTTTTAPAPQDKSLGAVLTDASGQSVATATATRSGTTVTLTFETMQLAEGNYTLTVRMMVAGTATPFQGSAVVHYPAAMVVDHEHDE